MSGRLIGYEEIDNLKILYVVDLEKSEASQLGDSDPKWVQNYHSGNPDIADLEMPVITHPWGKDFKLDRSRHVCSWTIFDEKDSNGITTISRTVIAHGSINKMDKVYVTDYPISTGTMQFMANQASSASNLEITTSQLTTWVRRVKSPYRIPGSKVVLEWKYYTHKKQIGMDLTIVIEE